MSFLFRFFTEDRQESRIKEFDGESVSIGRGGASNLVLVSRIIRLEHARLTLESSGLSIKLLAPNAPLFINNKPTSGGRLQTGDEFTVGNIQFTVAAIVDGAVEIHCIETAVREAMAELAGKSLLSHAFRTPYRLGLELAIAATLLGGAMPVFLNKWESWSTGPISVHHAAIESQCSTCHDTTFQRIQDKTCTNCHKLTEHSSKLTSLVAHQKINGAQCVDCHKEHRSETELTTKASGLCLSCHGDFDKFGSDVGAPSIKGFENHPEFKIREGSQKVSLDNPAVKDPGTIKLNHAVHLNAGLRSPEGPITLTCTSCHTLSPDLKTIIPITFEKNCRSCHPLTFDDRLPESQVPHGDTEAVFRYLLGEYSKFAAFGDSRTGKNSDRAIPGKNTSEAPPAAVIKEARRAEQVLYTQTSCHTCHEVQTKADAGNWSSGFEIMKANISQVWFANARFDHGAHQSVSCTGCHDKAAKSKATKDVLLPKVAECRTCHAQAKSNDAKMKGMVPTECSTCHAYHKSEYLGESRRSEKTLLKPPSIFQKD